MKCPVCEIPATADQEQCLQCHSDLTLLRLVQELRIDEKARLGMDIEIPDTKMAEEYKTRAEAAKTNSADFESAVAAGLSASNSISASPARPGDQKIFRVEEANKMIRYTLTSAIALLIGILATLVVVKWSEASPPLAQETLKSPSSRATQDYMESLLGILNRSLNMLDQERAENSKLRDEIKRLEEIAWRLQPHDDSKRLPQNSSEIQPDQDPNYGKKPF